MKDETRIGPNGREDDVTSALRAIYAPPSAPGYWDELEARVMARLIEALDDDGWWTPFGGWVRTGLVAAGLAAIAASVALNHTREAQARVAYEQIVETPRAPDAQLAASSRAVPVREATLRYVISH